MLALIEVTIKHGQVLQVFQPQVFQLTQTERKMAKVASTMTPCIAVKQVPTYYRYALAW